MENQKECWYSQAGGRGRVDSITCRNITEGLSSAVTCNGLFYILQVINLFFHFY